MKLLSSFHPERSDTSHQNCLTTNSIDRCAESTVHLIHDRRWSRRQKIALLKELGSIDAVLGLNSAQAQSILDSRLRRVGERPDQAMIARELVWLQESSHHLISYFDQAYPECLREIDDPPLALYAKGDLSVLHEPAVSIVGSRRPSPIGSQVVKEISGTLSSLGIVIVSGAALGIDGLAHRAALDVAGSTIAVLGNGINVVYPTKNKTLLKDIANNGLILSEYPIDQAPSRYTFPDRNRIVSGLSLGVVVIEAAERSGTLITARLATEQNRELMVVPGAAMNNQYVGSHRLIREGAALVCSGQDVVENLANELAQHLAKTTVTQEHIDSELPHISDLAQTVFHMLDYSSLSIDALVEMTGLAPNEVVSSLLELELQSMVATTAEGGYIKVI